MPLIYLGRGIADEYDVSDFAFSVFNGNITDIQTMIERSPDWKTDNMALYVAMRINRKDVFELLIHEGIHVPEEIFKSVLFFDESFLELLPKNDEALKKATISKATSDLNIGIFEGTITGPEVRGLLKKGADIHTPYFFNHSVTGQVPIQIATRYPDLTVFQELLNAGAHLNLMINKKSLARIVLENSELSRKEIKEFSTFFRDNRAIFSPELTFFDRFNLWLGRALPE